MSRAKKLSSHSEKNDGIKSGSISDSGIRRMRSSIANWGLQTDAPHPVLSLIPAYSRSRIIQDHSKRVGQMADRNSFIEFSATSVPVSSFLHVGLRIAKQLVAQTKPGLSDPSKFSDLPTCECPWDAVHLCVVQGLT